MINLNLLKTFLALIRSRSFQGAAGSLAIAQPTVSLHIQKLEEQLGVPLFRRLRGGCVPTSEAWALLPYAENLLGLNERALAAVRGRHVRVGASSNIGIYLLQPYLQSFFRSNESKSFDIVLDRNPAVAEKLETGELDIGLMEWWDKRPGLVARPWRREALVVIVPPEHEWSDAAFVTRKMLQSVSLIGGESGTGTGRQLVKYFGSAAAVPRVSRQLGSTEAVKSAVKAGLGVSMVLESAVSEEVACGSLVALPLEGRDLFKDLWLIWRSAACAERGSMPPFVEHLLGTG
ncbi:LysR family transcriptional regulator [Allohahella sp. A8]|uniref:LysR family transcriptional regulator n=1 Tax=Allohahella sp. A8 TaxID=3141461 RepID=UPI003A812E3A